MSFVCIRATTILNRFKLLGNFIAIHLCFFVIKLKSLMSFCSVACKFRALGEIVDVKHCKYMGHDEYSYMLCLLCHYSFMKNNTAG